MNNRLVSNYLGLIMSEFAEIQQALQQYDSTPGLAKQTSPNIIKTNIARINIQIANQGLAELFDKSKPSYSPELEGIKKWMAGFAKEGEKITIDGAGVDAETIQMITDTPKLREATQGKVGKAISDLKSLNAPYKAAAEAEAKAQASDRPSTSPRTGDQEVQSIYEVFNPGDEKDGRKGGGRKGGGVTTSL